MNEEIISFIDFTNMSDEEKYKLLNSKDYEIERLKNREQECIDHYLVQCKYASKMEEKYITANNIINELAFIFDDYNEFNKILEKYNYELKGSE